MCGPKPSGETNTATGRGVTADQIELGTISDPGFSGAPGLNQELFDASTVFTKWCNSLGGINGRLIKDDLLDAALVQLQRQDHHRPAPRTSPWWAAAACSTTPARRPA